ncbi:MAG: acyl-CoA dehydrogenase family protein [Acidimicrobiales bacterium]
MREELRPWLEANLTAEVVGAGSHMTDGSNLDVLRRWNRELALARWAAVSWPSAYGGRDASVVEQLAFLEEMARWEAPGPLNVIGLSNIAPAIMAFGTEEQRHRFLRPMLWGDEIWCQGMSEPDAGSDLASLRTLARIDGDSFVVNGQKTWNSLGHHADWCQLYVRTDATVPQHRGISCLLVDMSSAGIMSSPIRTMDGATSFAELFFDDVRVPASALLGQLHGGWQVAMNTLSHERAGVARLHLMLTNKLRHLLGDAAGLESLAQPVIRHQIASLYSRIACMRWLSERFLVAPTPSPVAGSLAKLAWARAEQELSLLAGGLLGPSTQLGGPWATQATSAPSTSIAGGTTEINLNIVAEIGLGLPKEPRSHG